MTEVPLRLCGSWSLISISIEDGFAWSAICVDILCSIAKRIKYRTPVRVFK